ncbi:hypothetical protein SBI_08199 [Streptomyces bingchenggensis BCW-1]|uniref:Uncharacterized protein n=1 Tax=Streptomyces bingchenggensis (strain BCW-1) TaxID=749414 RepID=D7CID9_STRBB|nr:hypothetical protein SBI_08199 [Streptomyces bingchenggensis BCW-1]
MPFMLLVDRDDQVWSSISMAMSMISLVSMISIAMSISSRVCQI